MNYQLTLWTFTVLMILHVIGDFATPVRQFGNGTIKQFLKSEFFIVLNPLHWIWDLYSPLRRHTEFMKIREVYWEFLPNGYNQDLSSKKYEPNSMQIHPLFWRWLAVDQLYHVLTNLLVAFVIGAMF